MGFFYACHAVVVLCGGPFLCLFSRQSTDGSIPVWESSRREEYRAVRHTQTKENIIFSIERILTALCSSFRSYSAAYQPDSMKKCKTSFFGLTNHRSPHRHNTLSDFFFHTPKSDTEKIKNHSFCPEIETSNQTDCKITQSEPRFLGSQNISHRCRFRRWQSEKCKTSLFLLRKM